MEWTPEETRVLLRVWGDTDIQSKFDGVVRNRHIYEKIAENLKKYSYCRTWIQCRTKIKSIVQKYRKIKDENRSGTCPIKWQYFEDVDAILGNRAASTPPILLDTGRADVDDKPPGSPAFPSTVSDSPPPINDKEGEIESIDGPSTSNTNPVPVKTKREAITERKKGKKRERNERVDICELLIELEERAERRYEEREERARKFDMEMEERRAAREEKQENQMLNMISTLLGSASRGYQNDPYVSFSPYTEHTMHIQHEN